jgi:hypothetical protein
MSIVLEERITAHASYINMERVIQILNEISSSDISVREIEMLERVNVTFDFLKNSLDKVDPWLISTSTLDNLNNPISQVLREITSYNNNGNEGHLANVCSYLESLVSFFSQIVVTRTPEEIEGVRSSIIKFRQSVGQHLGNIEREANETSVVLTKNTEKLNELTTSIDTQKSRIDTIVSDFQSQFLQNQTQRTEQFTTFLKESESEFNDIMENRDNSLKQQLIEQSDSFKSLTDDFKTKMQSELDQINAMNKEAEKILGIMSMKGLAQGYQKIANSEGWKAIVWNIISLSSLIGVLVFGYQFIILHEGTMSWTTLISRIVLTGVGITLFTYCAKQAANHRTEERHNRRIELELASLDPYIKDLEPDKQKEVKQNLVEKYFGAEIPSNNTPQQSLITQPQQQQQQQQQIMDAISSNPQLLQALSQLISQK